MAHSGVFRKGVADPSPVFTRGIERLEVRKAFR